MKTYPLLGVMGVLVGGSISVLSGQLLTQGMADLRAGNLLSIDDAAWIPTAYNMALVFTGILSVYLGSIFGARIVLLIASSIATVAFFLTIFARQPGVIMFLLVIAGLGVGTFYPLIISNLLRLLPFRFALFGLAIYVIDVLVPSYLGTWIQGIGASYFSYRSIFWIPTLVIPFVFLFAFFGLPQVKPAEDAKKVNFKGFFYAAFGFAFLYGVLDQGQRLDWFENGTFTGLFFATIIFMTAVLIRRLKKPNPLFRLDYLWNRNFIILGLVLLFFRFSLLTTNLLVPTFLSGVFDYRPIQTGPVQSFGVLPLLFVAPIVVILFLKVDFRLLLATGFGLAGVACWMFGKINPQWSNVDFLHPIAVQAVGQPFIAIPLIGVVIVLLAKKGELNHPWKIATLATFLQTVRLLGGIATTAILRHFIHVQNEYYAVIATDHFQPGNWRIAERIQIFAQQAAFASNTSEELIGRTGHIASEFVTKQVLTLTVADAFHFLGGAMVISLIAIAFLRPAPLKGLINQQ